MSNFHDSREEDADARYLMPAQISFVDRLEVSEEKSPRSMQATFSIGGVCDDDDDDVSLLLMLAVVVLVRVTASKAIPAPVAPPPITRMS